MSACAALLEAALGYARRGWPVFPVHEIGAGGGCSCHRRCDRPGKHPRTRHGHHDATTDAATLRAWWRRWPQASIGVACRPSGLLVLDIDPRAGGDDALAELERLHGNLPETVRSQTGGGGAHVFLQRPRDVVDRPIATGVDVKASGYVVAPPSVHASGREYVWFAGYAPTDLPLAAAPPWLVALVAARRPPQPRPRAAGSTTDAMIPRGERNDTLFRFAMMLRRPGRAANELERLVLAVNAAHCVPPLPVCEVRGIVRSSVRYSVATSPARRGGVSQ